MHVVWARGWEGDGAPAFWPWVQVLRTLAEETPVDTLNAAIEGSGADIARVVPDFARFVTVADDAPDAETARFRFFEAVATLLRHSRSRQPIVVVLDDLHWADQSSLRLLEFAVNGLAAVVRVPRRDVPRRRGAHTAAREHARDARADERPRTSRTVRPDASTRSAITSPRWSGTTPTRRSRIRCTIAPPAIRSSSRSWSGCCTTKGSSPAPPIGATVPEGVRDVLRTRLARLPDEAVTVLTAGAIAGREFDVALVAHVCGIDEDRALDLVEAAWMTGIVDEAHDGLGHFRFSHELVRETLVEGLTSLRRIRLHRRIGEAIEELHGERNPGFLTECAYHFAEAAPAGDALKAVLYGQRAADRLNAQLAYEDAIPTYERALELVDAYDVGSWQTRTDLLIGLGWALRATGRLGDARLALRRAMERARTEGDPVRIARAVLGIGGGGFWGWWDEFGVADLDLVAYLERALEALDDEDSVLRCELFARLAVEGYFAFSRERRRALSADALAMARRLDDPVALTAALAGRAARRLEPRQPRTAARARRRAGIRRGRERHRVRGAHRPTLPDGRPSRVGRPRRRRRGLRRVRAPRRAARPLRLPRAARVVPLDARVHRRSARRRGAAHARRVRAQPRVERARGTNGLRRADVSPTARAGSPRRDRGDAPRLARNGNRSWHSAMLTGVATIAGEHGRTEEARDLVDSIARRPTRSRTANDLLVPLHAVHLAEAAVASRPCVGGRASPATVLRDHAGAIALLATGHLCFGAVERARGDVARTLGRLDEAIAHYERAIDIEEAVGARIYANRSRLGLAVALAARDEDERPRAGPGRRPGGRAGGRGARHADGRRLGGRALLA